MLLKIAGSLIILTSTSFLGFFLSRDCAKRPHQLRELQGLLQMLENEIVYLSNLLIDAFYKINDAGNSEISVLFKSTADHLKYNSNLNACEAWEKAIKENISKSSLDKEDSKILIQFGKMLGNSDIEGQQKNIRLAITQLSLQEKKAEENKNKYEAMYKRLGVLGGLAIVILLI